MDLRACVRCGSADLRIPSVRDGVLVGTAQDFGRWACNRCDLTAVPLLFDSDKARRAYEAERAKDPSTDWPPPGWPDFHLLRERK